MATKDPDLLLLMYSIVPEIQSEFPRPEVSEYQRPITPVAVTDHDVAQANNKINTLKFEMETIVCKEESLYLI